MSKKNLTFLAAVLLISSISFQSCIGSFSLTNKVLTWNKNVSNKFVNELVFFAFWVLPVYEVTAAADLLVINSIEFWSGNIPMEANNKVVETENGNYLITASDYGYKVTSPDGRLLCFDFDKDSQTWSFKINEGEEIDFLKFTDENHVKILNHEGVFVDAEISEKGVEDYVSAIGYPLFALN